MGSFSHQYGGVNGSGSNSGWKRTREKSDIEDVNEDSWDRATLTITRSEFQ